MKKLSFPLAILAIGLSIFTFSYNNNKSELVYVDVNKLLEGYKRTKIVRGEFEVKAKTLQSNVDSLVTDWQKELKTYEKERTKYSKRELELKQELLGNKQQQINNYEQAIQKQIQEQDDNFEWLDEKIKLYGKDFNNLHKHSFKDIVNHEFFKKDLPHSFKNSLLVICTKTCGV